MRLLATEVRGRIRFVAGVWFVAATVCGSSVASAQSRPQCVARTAAGQAIERGWSAYRKGDVAAADAEFKRALSLCPNDPAALTGAGYAAMRRGRLDDARNLFRLAVAGDSTSYDAVSGAGMAAYRDGD
ncbi:MAG: hypothetical protein JWL97_2901, partial [Gemmatimonadales bacterium]|nr:hypothetical protein [Gemmatimonadales bacterium]